jgi:predicted O-methyltransferase YrrM
VPLEAVPVTPEIEAYLESLLAARDGTLARLEREAEETGVPIVGPQVGTLLYLLASLQRPQRMLELGAATGYSAIWLALGAPDAGLVTTELDAGRAERARRNFAEAGVANRVRLVEGDAVDYLERAGEEFDLIFNDLLNSFRDEVTTAQAFELSLRRLRPGGLLIADNALRRGEVLRPESKGARNVVRYNELIGADPRVRGLIIPIRDGVSVARLEA